MDETLEEDPQREALEQVISLLTPLRQHRQASAERAHRQAQVELKSMLDHLSETRASLDQERDNHKRRRESLSQDHLQKTISLNDVDRWHEKEKKHARPPGLYPPGRAATAIAGSRTADVA